MSLANPHRARVWFITAAVCGFLAVAFGAFGAHALAPMLSEKALDWFDKANHYQQFHTLAILGCALTLHCQPTLRLASIAAMLFLAGIVFFSGSLYFMALTGQTGAALLTPIGGTLFLAGWITLALAGKALTTDKGQAT